MGDDNLETFLHAMQRGDLPGLTHVDLSGNPGITDEGVLLCVLIDLDGRWWADGWAEGGSYGPSHRVLAALPPSHEHPPMLTPAPAPRRLRASGGCVRRGSLDVAVP